MVTTTVNDWVPGRTEEKRDNRVFLIYGTFKECIYTDIYLYILLFWAMYQELYLVLDNPMA